MWKRDFLIDRSFVLLWESIPQAKGEKVEAECLLMGISKHDATFLCWEFIDMLLQEGKVALDRREGDT